MGVSVSVTTMIFTILASSLVLLAAVTEARPQEEWATYKAIHGKEYSKEEDLMRFSLWLQNKEMVDAHNNGDHGYKMALMDHSDWTQEEFEQRRLGYIQMPHNDKIAPEAFEGVKGPNSVDHRNSGLVTGVKNQAQCGSCWAFSATGCMEGAWMRKTGQLIPLSEQQLVDCSSAGSCQGGMMGPAWEYAQRKGLESESAYPYYGQDMSCRYNAGQVVAYAAGWHRVSANEQSLENAIYQVGYPISIAVHVGSSFQHYSGGVFSDPSCQYGQLNHAVLLVGYNKDSWGQHYWIVKNSWGTGWGQGGYIHMKMGENSCGIAKDPMYVVV